MLLEVFGKSKSWVHFAECRNPLPPSGEDGDVDQGQTAMNLGLILKGVALRRQCKYDTLR
jgi:hypothetical protein